ncbi:hypothetical protein C9374_014245 [Naegleria lovaniensis]|uniref:EngB-type G domain-containing protein n=1 Tax=Naegleria lovaniensis TaxID=51637 RepID=A0AA88KAJ8_NAELO|nr:uncharacterized protein C9374_014245 [Naegleria lovaniensis]KAG2370751.1 hypothetical protein C9374_014245 [Naegleria lovaniensis]
MRANRKWFNVSKFRLLLSSSSSYCYRNGYCFDKSTPYLLLSTTSHHYHHCSTFFNTNHGLKLQNIASSETSEAFDDVILDEEQDQQQAQNIIISFDPLTLQKKYTYTFGGIPVPSPPFEMSPPIILDSVDTAARKLQGDIPVTFSDIEYIFRKEESRLEFSCGSVDEFPNENPEMPQIAFAGRSNVGKSSLLNALVDSDRLARVSATPGHTKRVNYFNMNNLLYVVDLPGYGFAEGNVEKIRDWNVVFREYCVRNSMLKRVFILIDARYGIYEQDCEFMDMLEEAGISYQIVLTKCDKVSSEHLNEMMNFLYNEMKSAKIFKACFPYILPTSSEKMIGIQDVKAAIIRASGILESGALFSRTEREAMASRMENILKSDFPDHPYFKLRDQVLKSAQITAQNQEKYSTQRPTPQQNVDINQPGDPSQHGDLHTKREQKQAASGKKLTPTQEKMLEKAKKAKQEKKNKVNLCSKYWQLIDNGLIRLPILSPYIAGDNAELFTELARKEMQSHNHDDPNVVVDTTHQPCFFTISTPGRNTFVFWDKDSCKEIFLSKASSFGKPIEIFYEPFNIFDKHASSVLTAPDGPVWKKHHHVVSPSFSTSNLQYMCQVATKSCDLLFNTKWNKLLEKNNKFILDVEDFASVTLEIIGEAGFGIEFGIFSETSDEGMKFRENLTHVIRYDYIIRFFFREGWMRKIISQLVGNEQALEYISTKLSRYIEQRQEEFRKDPEKPLNDLLSQLVKANMGEESEQKLNVNELKSNAYIFVVAGHETTSTTLQWIMYELGKNRQAQQKVREEALRIGGQEKRAPTFEDYPNMEYIHAVVMETLRLHPPVPHIVKECTKKTTIGNTIIPKGSNIILPARTCHLLSSDFTNSTLYQSTDFAPERFLDKEFKQRVISSCSWFPFSFGNRRCIGYVFSQIETCMILCRMAQFYEFTLLNDESNPKEKVTNLIGLTMRPSTNMKVLIQRIED